MTACFPALPRSPHLHTLRRNNGRTKATANELLTTKRSAGRRATAAAGRLNAFFANSVNSPSMSVVNFSCCSAPNVIRKATAQPTHSAFRMEAGVHAGV
jgi:hypothetical protein